MRNYESPGYEYFSLPQPTPEASLNRWNTGSVDFHNVQTVLQDRNIEVQSGRELLSGGFNGPLFKINTNKGPVVEKTFISGGAKNLSDVSLGKRLRRVQTSDQTSFNRVNSRLGVVNPETGKVDEAIIDWVYNEETALKSLQGIDGIPKYIGAVYEKLKGSILEEYIDGYDILEIANKLKNEQEIKEVFSRLKIVYQQAAEKGFILNNPGGSTVMVDATTKQPYLMDWYNYQRASLNDDLGEKLFTEGLKEIDEMESMVMQLRNLPEPLKGVESKLSN